jgi:D-galacturonate reductase
MAALPRVACLMVGTGEYTSGYGASAGSDKKRGVVGLTIFDLKRRGFVSDVLMSGSDGTKLPAIRAHMEAELRGAYPASFGAPGALDVATYPADGVKDGAAYKQALAALPRGSAVIIFTPDDTHFAIALDAVRAGMHVLVTKPIVMTLAQHLELAAAAAAAGALVAVEVHKRWDPIYSDARNRLRALGDFSYLNAYMSQPKAQLETFKAWAGKSSDISYYLNSHHVDFSEWAFGSSARPLSVVARGSTAIGEKILGRPVEDTIALMAEWENLPSRSRGTAVYTASWVAPRSDVHSQQRFHCMTALGEVTVDQAHRGYSVATDAAGFASANPLFFCYTPSPEGAFVGQQAYGYRSFEAFIDAVQKISAGAAAPRDFDSLLATVHTTQQGTAILEAGRVSLDNGGATVDIVYEGDGLHPVSLKVRKA